MNSSVLAPTFAAALDGVADALSCDRLAVLLTETARAVRRGAKSRILRLRYQYDLAMNEPVKAAGQAYFDRHCTRAWDIILDAGAVEALQAAIPAYERLFPELPVAPLASDLVTLIGTGYGLDCAASGTIAYVRFDNPRRRPPARDRGLLRRAGPPHRVLARLPRP